MSEPWSIAGVDLHLDLGTGGRRAGLTDALREAVRAGRLAPGTRLPASRVLAGDLGLSRGTVTAAYGQLVAEGYLVARPGAGTAVADRPTRTRSAPVTLDRPLREPVRYDLRPGLPDLAAFPRRDWLAAARTALADADHAALGFGDPRGHPGLRAELAGYLGRVRAVRTEPGAVMVCAGFAHGLSLVCAVLRDRGVRAIAVEDPYLPPYREVAEAAGLRTVPVPVDADGIRVDRLATADVGAAVVTPAHQFPLGVALAPGRRTELVAWARRTGALLIEDDYDGEYRYDREPLGALQGLAPESTIYLGTASKTLAPGLRLGWLAAPPELAAPLVRQRRYTDRHTGVLEQLTFAELIRSGRYDRHVRRSRATYRRRRDELVAALPPGLPVTGIAAGLHLLVGLPPGVTEPALIAAARRRSLGLDGLARHYGRAGRRPAQLVIGYGTPPDHAFRPALRILVDLLTGYRPRR